MAEITVVEAHTKMLGIMESIEPIRVAARQLRANAERLGEACRDYDSPDEVYVVEQATEAISVLINCALREAVVACHELQKVISKKAPAGMTTNRIG